MSVGALSEFEGNQCLLTVSPDQNQETNNRGQIVAYSNQNQETNNQGQLVVSSNQTRAVVSLNQRQEINDRLRQEGANQVKSDGLSTARKYATMGGVVGLVGLIFSSRGPCRVEFSSEDIVVAVGGSALVSAVIGYVKGSLFSQGTVPHVTGTILHGDEV